METTSTQNTWVMGIRGTAAEANKSKKQKKTFTQYFNEHCVLNLFQ